MPTLDWIGKQAVVNHHREVPYRLLKCDREKSFGDPEAGNLLVQGDNLEALKALLPYYAGKVKCIYIDPPYNTGNEDWRYNDNVNSPEMQSWLGKTVRKEGEDLSRHDKWLCMMYPRLRLLKEFLALDGFLFCSIDDHEYHRLRELMDEIFGRAGFVCNFIWKSRKSEDTRAVSGASSDHEYILCYSGEGRPKLRGADKDLSKFTNADSDKRGPWRSADLTGLAERSRRPNLHYDLINPDTGDVFPCPPKGWRFERATMARKIDEGRILWPSTKSGRPRHKLFLSEITSDFKNISSVITEFSTSDGTRELADIVGPTEFQFPKPSALILALIQQASSSSEFIVLDAFCGSGTTGHAVLNAGASLGLDARAILIEISEDVATNVAMKRLRKVIDRQVDKEGFTGSMRKGVGFRYCTLGAPLFDASGDINEAVAFRDLAAHVFFCETGSPIPKQASPSNALIGAFQNRAIYLLYNRDSAGVASQRAGNVLNLAALDRLPETDAAERVVYAEGCTIPSDRLRKAGVVFKQIPYQIGGL